MAHSSLDATDRALIQATQAGLPICAEPYASVASALQIPEDEVLQRLASLQRCGIIRRIGVVPNHYALGMVANGMSVWDVEDGLVDRVGAYLGAMGEVTHCYRRPRRLPAWPYNLFAMVHGRDRAMVEHLLSDIEARLARYFPQAVRKRDVLFSSAILKKTGIRLQGQ